MKEQWEDIPDYGDVMTVEEWHNAVECGGFIDYDGYGYYVKNGKMSRDHLALPSRAKGTDPPTEFTHVCWFNR